MWQTYYTHTSIEEALRQLAEHGPEARIIAGGTDLLVELQRGTRQVRVLADVTRVSVATGPAKQAGHPSQGQGLRRATVRGRGADRVAELESSLSLLEITSLSVIPAAL